KGDLDRVLTEPLKPYFTDFARVLVAAADWISEDELLEVLRFEAPRRLDWDVNYRDEITQMLTWFLDVRAETRDDKTRLCYPLPQEGVRDFRVSPKWKGPARSDLPQVHARIGTCFLKRAQEGASPTWQRVAQYGRFFAVHHLLQAQEDRHLR